METDDACSEFVIIAITVLEESGYSTEDPERVQIEEEYLRCMGELQTSADGNEDFESVPNEDS